MNLVWPRTNVRETVNLASPTPAPYRHSSFRCSSTPEKFRFGRETDGSPSAPWGWEDLDLWPAPRPQAEQKAQRSAQQRCPFGDRPPDTPEHGPASNVTCYDIVS